METNPADLATINAALSHSVQVAIESMAHPDPKFRRGVDFALLDRAAAAVERLAGTIGPDTAVPGRPWDTPAGLRAALRDVLANAEPYRPKARRA